MTMSFYDHQDDARLKSKLLILYFAVAVILIICAVDMCVYLIQIAGRNLSGQDAYDPDWKNIHLASGITGGVILLGSLYRYWSLRGGGRSLAWLVKATAVDPQTEDTAVLRYMHVVEEMSIASGTPMPELYVMEEEAGINAFVAGYGPHDTVMVFTRGAIDNFDRDELQGVVAHEFSHIYHGDVRLNMHIIAVLAGVLLISQLGGFMIRGVPYSERYFYKHKNLPPFMLNPFLMVAGAIIWFIGSLGLLAGELIQAAISRQREYLADASSVQFTRNPEGIAKALKKIYLHAQKSRLFNLHAREIRYICFGETMRDIYDGMFSSHPPLLKRIKEVDPSIYYSLAKKEHEAEERQRSGAGGSAEGGGGWVYAGGMLPLGAAGLAALMNVPTPEHAEFARRLHAAIPDDLLKALHLPEGARGAVYSLLVPDGDGMRDAALKLVRETDGYEPGMYAERLGIMLHKLGPRARLPMLGLATPALKRLNAREKETLKNTMGRLIGSNRRVSLFEYVLYTLVNVRLEDGVRQGPVKYTHSIHDAAMEAGVVVSALAWAGSNTAGEAKSSFDSSMRLLGLQADAEPLRLEKAIRLMDHAFDALDKLVPKEKERLLNALADCVMRDNQVMVSEAELLRAVAERLGCPMPPLMAGVSR